MHVRIPCSIAIGRNGHDYLLLPGKSIVDTSTWRVIYVGQPDTLGSMGCFGFMVGTLVSVNHLIPEALRDLFLPWQRAD